MIMDNSFRHSHSSGWSSLLFGCLILVLVGVTTSCEKKEEPIVEEVVRPVKVMTVESSEAALDRIYPGKVRASQRVDLAFQVDGPLVELPVDEGQRVEKDQLIARIDPRDFEVNLRDARAKLARAEAALKLAQSDYERVSRIRKQDPGAISQADVDKKLEALDGVKADIEAFTAAVDAAKLQLSYTYLRAPFAGVTATRHVDNFQEVRAKQPIVTLDNISHLEILVDVPEMVMANVRGGDTTGVAEFEAAPGRQFPLNLKEYSTRADPKTQTYRIVLTMPAPEGVRILHGMTANVHATTIAGDEGDGFVIPAIAVFSDESGNPQVWVVDQSTNTVQRRDVMTGDLTGTDSIQVLDGLEPGEMIAISGVSRLRERMKIRPVERIEF
jgi:RND family efflux transporter MFP subunit